MEGDGRPPHSDDIPGELFAEPGDRAEALRRAREAATRAASLREGGDEFAAVVAEMSSRTWLRKFVMLSEQLPDGGANQDFPIAKA